MNRTEKHHQQHIAAAWAGSSPARWRIGNASVSTEELRAWQLGPARVDAWLAIESLTRPGER